MVGNSGSKTDPSPGELPAARLVLSLLGPPEVLVNGEPACGLGSQKVLALLGYLAVEARRWHLRSGLAALLWPDQPAKQAYQNLRKTLSRLRRVIGDDEADPPHLISDSLTIQFNPQSDYRLDVDAFRTLLANTERHPHRRLGVCLTCVSQLAQACDLYRGDLLAELYVPDSFALDEWLLVEREQLRQQACSALHALAGAHLAHGEFEAARRYAQRLLQLDLWNEAGLRLLLRALAASDQRNAALQYFEAFREELAEELQVAPEDTTLDLVAQIRAGALEAMRPRTSSDSLPVPATSFVGREAERKLLTEYLAGQDQRLITVYGPGGCGKTRLAMEIATEQAPLWREGVWFVSLAEVPDSEHLVDALAGALGLRTANRSPEPADLIDFLREKELLLILDGFEHLVAPPQSPPKSGGRKGGVGLLQDVLRWAPEVRILVTSRARLGLREEWAVKLDGLDVPLGIPASASEAEGYSAVQLFLQNAGRVRPDFALTPENLPHVIRICRLVEGLPLGIELAAAWVRLFSCQHIADEIERSPDFLHNPESHNPGRQHSLRATFEHSYNLLSETDQGVLRKLSIFRGGFTTEAAQEVAGANPSNLASLLDKSLLQVSPSKRLALHLALRQYAAEKLAGVPEEERQTRERHGHAYLSFVREREASLWEESPQEALDEIELELSNVRTAWHWAVEQASTEDLKAGINGLSRFYDLRALLQEAEAAFGDAAGRVLALVEADVGVQRLACWLLAEQAHFLQRQAQYPKVSQVAQAAIELAQTTQEELAEAHAAFLLGEALWRQGDRQAARPHLERALALARARHDAAEGAARDASARALSRAVEMSSLNTLGGLCWVQGDYAGARAYIEQALHIAVNSGNRQHEAKCHMHLGVLAVEQGNYAEARRLFQQSLHIHQALGDRRGESLVLGNLGNVFLYLGVYVEAKTHYEQALRIQREIGDRKDEALSTGNLGLVYHYLGEHGTARQYSRQALRIAQEIGERRAQGAMWMKLGHALAGLGRLDEAAAAYGESVTVRRAMGAHNMAMEPLAGLARVALTRGDLPQAQAHVEEILSHLETGTLHGTIDPFEIYLTCYRVLEANEDPRAGDILTTAHDLLQERAAKITDEEMRQSLVERVPAHREIVEQWREVRNESP